jgi:molybdenum cofactor cytidylyltransferase
MTAVTDRRQTADVIVGVLLAGGSGTRFRPSTELPAGTHKLDAALRATSSERAATVFERSLAHLLTASIGPVVVVTGGWHPTLASSIDATDEVTVVDNPLWADGQITSVRVGVAAAAALGASRVVLGLADQPFVSADAWRTVALMPGPICVATYGGRRANPVGLDRSVWALLPDTGDEGARALMRIRPDLVREVACSGSPADIDTEEDLIRWQNN